MFIHLDNNKTFLVPLDKFPDVKALNIEQREDFEIIDDTHLSFLAIDEVYSLEQLMGMEVIFAQKCIQATKPKGFISE